MFCPPAQVEHSESGSGAATQTLIFPDYAGNLMYQTLGNLLKNPTAGVVFPDFKAGDLLLVSGTAEVLWDHPLLGHFRGAQRFVRLEVKAAVRLRGALRAVQFDDHGQGHPILEETGTWREAYEAAGAAASRVRWWPLRVARAVDESSRIRSLYLEPVSERSLSAALPLTYRPGQHLPIRLQAGPDTAAPVLRTYTLSQPSDGRVLRISVKREDNGCASRLLHALGPGDTIEAQAPRGSFVLEPEDGPRAILLLSAGVGITPMIAMLEHLVRNSCHHARPVYFLHCSRNSAELPFGERLREIAAAGSQSRLGSRGGLVVKIFFSQPLDTDILGTDFDVRGRIGREGLRRTLALDDYDVYLCGPGGFMQSSYDALRSLGVRAEQIHSESFGPSSLEFASGLVKEKSSVAEQNKEDRKSVV